MCDMSQAALDPSAHKALAQGMIRRAPKSGFLDRLLLAVMVAVVTAGSLLPAGWMPVRSAENSITLELCTPDGPREVKMPLPGGSAPTHGDQSQTCVWALAQAAALLANALALPAAPSVLVAAVEIPAETHLIPAGIALRPASRAPPALT